METPKTSPKNGLWNLLVIGFAVAILIILCCTHVICLSHDWQAATCTKPSVCAKCGRTQGTAAGHTEEILPAKESTCTETGLTEGKKCSVCGEVLTAQEDVPALGHTPVVETGFAPTCTKTGLTDGTRCSVCGKVVEKRTFITPLGHTEEILPAKEPTCTEAGLTEGKKCSVCGEILTAQEEIAALGHTEEVLPAKEPTLTETGLTEGKKCSVCGEILVAQDTLPVIEPPVVTESEAYRNEKLGFTYTLPEGWTCLSKEEIAAALGTTAQLLEDSEALDELSGIAQEAVIFSASDPATGSSVVITMQEIPEMQRVLFAAISEADLLAATGEALPAMYGSMGISIGEIEYGTIEFAGDPAKAYICYPIIMNASGNQLSVSAFQVLYFTETKLYSVTCSGLNAEALTVARSGFAGL